MNIYEYEDYRILLKDLFAQKQALEPKYSQRQFAREAGISNPGFLNDVIQGRRKLSKTTLPKMCQVFGLKESECEYFQLLVEFNHAKKPTDRDSLYKKILFRRSRTHFAKVNPELHHYYSDHNYPLVRSAIEVLDFRGSWDNLYDYFDGKIAPAQLKKIVRELCEWKMIYVDENGKYEVSEKFIEPPKGLNKQVRFLNKQWLERATDALFEIPPEQRHISTAILNIDEKTHQVIQDKIESLRAELFELAASCATPTKSIQFSIAEFTHGNTEVKSC